MFKGYRGGSGGGGGGGTTDIIVPFGFAAMTDTAGSGTGPGCSWSYNSSSEIFTVSLNVAQSNTNYSVITTEEFASGTGSRYMLVQNKTVSGFEVQLYGGYGPSGGQKIMLVYAEDPEVTVGNGGGGGGGVSTTYAVVNVVTNSASPFTLSSDPLRPDYISADSSGGVVEINIPSPTGLAGKQIIIKDAAGQAATNKITVNCTGLIDNVSSVDITNNWGGMNLWSDGIRWGMT